MMRDDKHWKLDRRIPIAVIGALVMQMMGAIIWVTELDARVSYVENQSLGNINANEKFARLEERLDAIRQNVDSIKRDVSQITDRLLKK